MKLSNFSKIFTLLLTMVFTFVTCGEKSKAKKASKKATESLVIATASTGGTFYPVGVGISTLVSIKLAKKHKITMNAMNSAGSGENIQLLKNKEADFAILQALFGAMAWQGSGKYKGKPERSLRAVTMLWENVEHFTLAKDLVTTGNINDLNNAKGKRFSIGKRGSGTEVSGRTILKELGFNLDKDFTLEHLGYSSSASALRDKRIVAMNTPAGVPVSAIIESFATLGNDKIKVLNFTEEQIKKTNSKYPVWSKYVIPPNTYTGQKEEITTIAQPNFLAVRPSISEDVVYKITKTIYENLPFLQGIHKATLSMKLEKAIAGLSVPLHSGAIKFYKEKGITIPKHLILK